jgi:CelD/BcsL family acetyltransferase involved in cellulose biosynthesis
MSVDSIQPRVLMRTSLPSGVAEGPVGVRFELVDQLVELREEWTDLAEQGDNVFATWEFAATWWDQFGGGRRLLTVGCRDPDGTLFAVLPLYLWKRRPLRVMRFLGNGAGDVLGPVCCPERRADAGHALRRLLDIAPWDWDVFVGENLPGDEGWSARLGGQVIRREGNPALRATDGFEQFLGRRSSSFRKQVRYRERQLFRRHHVRYRLSQADTLDADLDTLFRLHAARFRSESAFGGSRTTFHRAFAHRASDRGWLRLWILELDGRPVAAEYGFRLRGRGIVLPVRPRPRVRAGIGRDGHPHKRRSLST